MKNTKKILSIFLALLMIITIIPMSTITANAEGYYFDYDDLEIVFGDYEYAIMSEEDKTCIIEEYRGTDTNVAIPSNINGYKVVEIYLEAFAYCSYITNIVIPDSVETIHRGAFIYCTGLSSVTLGNGLKIIDESAFAYCSSLNNLTIPDNVTSIGVRAFGGCTSLTSISIGKGVQCMSYISYETNQIGSYGFAFYNCTSLTNITVDNDNEYYSNDENGSLFNKDKTILMQYPIGNTRTNYTIPGSVTSIGQRAFYGCTSLTSITIPDSVTSIGEGAFSGCTSFTSITIPDSVTSIGDYAFYDCTNLTSATIGNSVTSIGQRAFYGCTSLTSITIPDSVTSIGEGAFSGCTSFTSVTIPDSVTSIGGYAFAYCSALTSVDLGNGVTSIGYEAFYKCTSLTSITIPDSVTSIGSSAFQYCTSLTTVYIGSSVSYIDSDAFYGCTSLDELVIDDDNPYFSCEDGILFNKDKTELISCLPGNNITDYTIPSTVVEIGSKAFYNCTSLTSITIPDSVISIGDLAFYSCTSLTSITIPDSVTSIGYGAFAYCTSFTSITIPDSVTSIGSGTFEYCTSLTSITIPDSVTSIGSFAFASCENLTSITIPDSVTSIGEYAFYDCTSLTSITIPDSVISIGDYAFSGTAYYNDTSNWENKVLYIGNHLIEAKTSISGAYEIKDGTITIADYAFEDCTSLTSVTIPDSVITIGNGAFEDCTSLASITIPDSVTSIGYEAFYNTAYYNDTSNWENNVLYIGNHLIEADTSISGDCEIKDGTITIADCAFEYCTNLTGLTVPASLSSFGEDVFNQCWSIEYITVDENNANYLNDENGVLFDKDKTILIQYPNGSTGTTYTVTDNVKVIGKHAFSGGKYLEKITITDGVTLIDDCAFYANDSIKCIEIPNSVTEISEWAFHGCDVLTDIYYTGTEEQWNNIVIGSYNDPLLNATIHFLGESEHTHSYNSVVTPPTCTEQGYTTYTCSCGDSYISDYIEPSHTPKSITIPATCTVAGMTYTVCEACGETIGDSTVILTTGHTAGEWEVVLEPTYEADGKQIKKCTVCGETVEEETIPMLVKNVVTDEDTGVSMEFDNTDYDGVVDIVVEESFDGAAFDVIDTSLNVSQKFIYDITMTVDGEAVQPTGTVTVRIPLPEGYDPNRSFVYHVDTETGTVEKMSATYEDGYLVFETTHFSYYAVVEDAGYSFSIQTPSRTTIRHNDGIVLHANAENLPEGAYIRWTADNKNFTYTPSDDGMSLTAISSNNGDTTFYAIVYNADGEIIASDSVTLTSNAGFFQKFAGFFRSLFGSTTIYER